MSSSIKEITKSKIKEFLINGKISESEIREFEKIINKNPNLKLFLNLYFNNKTKNKIIPIFVINERLIKRDIFIIDKKQPTPEPGEQGSILGILRGYELKENYIESDCYGQLSCSSCAIEILNGKPKNHIPREEEYDMLDIDTEKKPTQYTRLGCQTIIGNTPLLIKIRK